jgi:hypothetical protein
VLRGATEPNSLDKLGGQISQILDAVTPEA